VTGKPIDRKTWIALVVSLVSLFAGIALFQLSDSQLKQPDIQSIQSSVPKPDTLQSLEAIPLIGLKGESRKLGDWKQPVLVINFWAPWCVPCRREVPDLISLQNEFNGQLQVLGLAYDSVENIESFAAEYQMNYPSFVANQHIQMYSAVFKNKSGALPFTAIIDRERKIVFTHTGIISLQALRQQVSKLL
jgi:thiol-disulfide isomerase/thioredoxin